MKTAFSKQLHYGWIILSLCFLSVFIALGFGSAPNSLYLAAITENMEFSRSLFSISDSCRYIATAVVNLFFGKMVAKYGPRKLLAAGFICLTLYCTINSFATHLWHFYLGSTMLGIGLSWTTTSVVGVLIEDWFSDSKGTIMGVVLASNGLGGALATQLVSKCIYSRPNGWRSGYLVCAIIMAAAGILIVLLIRNKPNQRGSEPLSLGSGKANTQRGSDWIGIDSHVACNRLYFYVCLVCVFLTGVVIISVGSISTVHLLDKGIDTATVVNAASLGCLYLMLSKTTTGFIFDRFGLRLTNLLCQLCTLGGIVLLYFADSSLEVNILQFVWAFGLPLHTIMLPLIAKECFGQKSYAFLMGLVVSINTLGYSISPPLMNWIFDLTGSYQTGLTIMFCLMVVLTVVMQFVISAAHKERRKITG